MATKKKVQSPALLATVWEDAYRNLKDAQAQEMAARLALAALIPDAEEGTNTLEVDDSLKIKVIQKFNYSIDQAALAGVLEDMPEGTEEKLVKYKPELKLAAFRTLTADEHSIFDLAVTINRGTPAVEVVRKDATPKPKRK